MADGTIKATVSIERIAHDAIREIVDRMWADHGLRIESVSVDWNITAFGPAEIAAHPGRIRIDTSSCG